MKRGEEEGRGRKNLDDARKNQEEGRRSGVSAIFIFNQKLRFGQFLVQILFFLLVFFFFFS